MEDQQDKPKRLAPNEQAFVYAYLGPARFSGVLAAEVANLGPKKPEQGTLTDAELAEVRGKWRNALRARACEMLKRPHVRAAIDEFVTVNAMSAAEVLSELASVAKIDVADHPNSVKNKVAALTVLAKHHGMLIDRIDHTSKGQPMTFADLVRQASEPSSGNSDNS